MSKWVTPNLVDLHINKSIIFVAIVLLTLAIGLNYSLKVNAQEGEGSVSEATTTVASDQVLVDGMPVPLEDTSSLSNERPFILENIDVGEKPEGDFVVGPGKIELEVLPGESKTVMMMLTNRIGKTHDFSLSVEDVAANQDPTVTVQLLGSQRGPYSLKDYITLPTNKITLEHGQRARFPVRISIPSGSAPGGHYGSILVKTLAVAGNDGKDQNLVPQSPIEARIGTLFFVTIPGEANREGKLLELSTIPNSAWFEQGPITFGVMFENTGSVHLAPFGKLSITNILGDEVGFVELDPWFALPKSQRFREVFWNNSNLLGRYTATIEVNRGYDKIIDTKSITFWILPWKIVLGVFSVVFIVLFLIRSFFKNFEFKRKG
jgi:hypothetical protein